MKGGWEHCSGAAIVSWLSKVMQGTFLPGATVLTPLPENWTCSCPEGESYTRDIWLGVLDNTVSDIRF